MEKTLILLEALVSEVGGPVCLRDLRSAAANSAWGVAPSEVRNAVVKLEAKSISKVDPLTLVRQICSKAGIEAPTIELAHVSFEWTLSNTSDSTKRVLGALPFRLDVRPLGGHASGPSIRLFHGNHNLNTFYIFEDRPDSMLESMATAVGARPGDVIAFGHTHKPWHREVAGVHFVNTGSVGRPKDGDWRAGYVLLDLGPGEPRIEHVRVAYDVEVAAAGVVAAGLPPEFAEFLRHGGTPSAVVA